jgi:hypothetical protein
LRLDALHSDARSTSFPTPSGRSSLLWELTLTMAATGSADQVVRLLDDVRGWPGDVHVPEVTITWSRTSRIHVGLTIVLLGSWSGASGRGSLHARSATPEAAIRR